MSDTGSSLPSTRGRAVRRIAGGAFLAGGLLGTTLLGTLPSAFANQDPSQAPPNCTAADLEGVRAGVSASTSAYLFTHPDFNFFVTSLKGLPRDQVTKQMQDYLNQHPDTKADITGIRQPLVDIKNRCGGAP
ncbi:membrane protein [Mycolicibacterium madagascariense]|uniref:Membrane protein n=1 Tax=Mycolicibacterium madagascariense TaxID=212765 RepID=A0A7I7XP12_9MYCO|nr:heme-binding protein [Mycolicibacterium madagascariense]MCV7015499.1 heme-binding protein [Mycolicibacterium madagascariense]BBZ30991.1 membrane protein [Mycolicibacterium madagascariense]